MKSGNKLIENYKRMFGINLREPVFPVDRSNKITEAAGSGGLTQLDAIPFEDIDIEQFATDSSQYILEDTGEGGMYEPTNLFIGTGIEIYTHINQIMNDLWEEEPEEQESYKNYEHYQRFMFSGGGLEDNGYVYSLYKI